MNCTGVKSSPHLHTRFTKKWLSAATKYSTFYFPTLCGGRNQFPSGQFTHCPLQCRCRRRQHQRKVRKEQDFLFACLLLLLLPPHLDHGRLRCRPHHRHPWHRRRHRRFLLARFRQSPRCVPRMQSVSVCKTQSCKSPLAFLRRRQRRCRRLAPPHLQPPRQQSLRTARRHPASSRAACRGSACSW